MALRGIKVVELAGLAPGPFCGMLLKDFGADVIRIDKIGTTFEDHLAFGKKSISVDIKKPEGVGIVKKLCKDADVLIEPFRKGVMSKLGLDAQTLMSQNPRLIYASLTGYGQYGPLSQKAGHDINYLAISGVLSMLGRANEVPTPPINILADFAGGGLMCAWGIVLALLEREKSGKGQVIDCSMVEGAAYISSFLYRKQDNWLFANSRGKNPLDTGHHCYNTYETSDGKYMAVGALEPQFYNEFLEKLQVNPDEFPQVGDFENLKKKLAKIFLTKTRCEWEKVFEESDACVTPILSLSEAVEFEHNKTRGSHVNKITPIPAPILSRTPGKASATNVRAGENTIELLKDLGYSDVDINEFIKNDIIESTEIKSKL